MEKCNFRLQYLYPTELDIESIEKKYFIFDFREAAITNVEKSILDSIHICHGCNYYAKSGDDLWKKENIQNGAHILSNLPEYLPVYMSRTANTIITELVGINQYQVGLDNPRIYYLLGKMHLSVFLATIEQLLKENVNLAELPLFYSHFYYLSTDNRYRNLENETSTDIYDVISSVTANCSSKNQESLLKKYGYYKNLSEFLLSVKEIMERTEQQPQIPNPEKLDYEKNRYFEKAIEKEEIQSTKKYGMFFPESVMHTPYNELDSLPEGEMVNATEYINKILNELNVCSKRARKQIIFSLIKKILDALKEKEQVADDDEYIEKLKELLKRIDLTEQGQEELKSALGKEDFEEFLAYIHKIREQNEKKELNKEIQDLKNEIIEQLLEEIEKCTQRKRKKELISQLLKEVTNIELTAENEEKISNLFQGEVPKCMDDSAPETEDTRTREELLAEIEYLKAALKNKERELEELKAIIYEYLKTGKNRPKMDLTYCSNDEIRKLLEEYQSNSRISNIRKYILIMALTASSMLGIFALNSRFSKENSSIESTSTIDSNPEIDDDNMELENPDNDRDSEIVVPTPEPTIDKPLQVYEEPEDAYEKIKEEIFLGKKVVLNQNYIYQSIFEKKPCGISSSEGIVIAYFPYLNVGDNREFYGSLRTKEQLEAFIQEHKDEITNIQWKAAFTEMAYEEEVKPLLENEVDASYTTFFIDFEPDLEKNKVYQH